MSELIAYAMRFVGLPYKWGGENALTGFDCSGLVQELLRSCGMDPPGDQTAQGLHDFFKTRSYVNDFSMGALCFFGKSTTEITHVGFMIDRFRMIEAGGGGHLTMSISDAASVGACVRMRLVRSRKDLVATLRPYYNFADEIDFLNSDRSSAVEPRPLK